MDIKLSEDQLEIAQHARRFCENESSIEYVRNMFEASRMMSGPRWQRWDGWACASQSPMTDWNLACWTWPWSSRKWAAD